MTQAPSQQCHFDFALKPNEDARDSQKWVERHNHQAAMAARVSSTPLGSLLSALDRGEAKANAVYLLRGVLGQQVRKSMAPGGFPFKSGFLHALQGEIAVKKTTRDPAFMVRDILIKTQTSL